MGSYKVVVTDQVFPDVELERGLLAEIDADLTVASGSPQEVLEVAKDADALLNTYLPIDADFLDGLERCRIVARYGIGLDNVDLDAARERGIAVTHVPDYSVEEVAAHSLALLLNLLRRIPDGLATLRDGEWGIGRVRPMRRLSHLEAGLIGYGRIARRLGDHLRSLGMSLIVFDPYVPAETREQVPSDVRFVDELDELLSAADAVSVHCPLTAETRGLIGPAELARMPAHAVLVNTSRGPLVQLEPLIEALGRGEIRAAGLDVVEEEPPPDPARLAQVPGLLVTPHVAFYSDEALEEAQRKATTQVIKALTGVELDYRAN